MNLLQKCLSALKYISGLGHTGQQSILTDGALRLLCTLSLFLAQQHLQALHQLIDALIHGRRHSIDPVQPAQIILGLLTDLIIGYMEWDNLYFFIPGKSAAHHVDFV